MGYIISFMLGVFVATVGFSNVAMVIDKTVHKAQVYMIESVKSNWREVIGKFDQSIEVRARTIGIQWSLATIFRFYSRSNSR